MTWQDDEIANPMGYAYCVLFDCARDALAAYREVTGFVLSLPENICPRVAQVAGGLLEPINQNTGLADLPVHLYGYQATNNPYAKVSLDPLMTGWLRHLKSESAIISFGAKKMLTLGYGGAFLTNSEAFAEEMDERGHWNQRYTQPLIEAFNWFPDNIKKRWEIVWMWDRYLGDSLIRIPQEQIMPWRVMRRTFDEGGRNRVVRGLRSYGFDVGTNYPPLMGSNQWGNTVLNFFCSPRIEEEKIQQACSIVRRATGGEFG